MRELIVASNPAKKRRSAAQRAASRRNIKKAQAARKRKRNPARRTTATRKPTRRRTSSRRRAPARRRSTRTRSVRRYSNPARLIPRNLVDRFVMPALLGGGGAVANDAAYSFVLGKLAETGTGGQLVQSLSAGNMRHLGKAASALLMTWAASFVLSRKNAETLGIGALTVVGYNVVRDVASRVAPGFPLGAYIEPAPALAYAGAGFVPGSGAVLDPRSGSVAGKRAGLAAYIRPERQRQLSTRGQLQQADPFRGAPAAAMEGYPEGYG